MKQWSTISLLLTLSLTGAGIQAQSIAGFWLGVTYPNDPKQAVYNYTMTLTQNGSTLGGTSQTANPKVPFGGIAYLSGQITLPTVTFSEADKNGSTAVANICFWQGKLTYNATDESLIGTYENITNATCKTSGSGKVELYRIVLKSGDTYCKGSPVNLSITGKNIRWYASSTSKTPLATGNMFRPSITQTTTFYVTQTLYETESPAVPITIKIIEPTFTITPTNPGCGPNSGYIALATTDSISQQYSLNGSAFQPTSSFSGLGPGSYTVTATNTLGCRAQQSVTLTQAVAPVIDNLQLTPPRCESSNGEVNVIASGGKAPYTYSIDYGVTFQSSSTFNKLSGGTYTFRVRDANKCEVNKALSIPATSSMAVLSIKSVATTCGQANGQISMTTSGGQSPVQYGLDSQTFQSDNTFKNLPSGSYTILARDNMGCQISQAISVAASTGPQLADVKTQTEGCGKSDGGIAIVAKQTSAVLDYSIDGQTFQRNALFSGLKAGMYTLTARDTNNCMTKQTVQIPLDCPNLVYLPTAFSPNADQMNDALTVHFAFPSLTILRFTVYDRWGAVLYSRANFELLTGESVWDGQVNGQPAQAGIYAYRLDCLFPDGTQTSYRESVALLNE